MARLVPIPAGKPAFTEHIDLDGVEYALTFRWNTRARAWFLDIADAADEPLVSSLAVCVGTPLTAHLRHGPRMPQGTLTAIDTTQRAGDPGLDDLGVRVLLVYLTAAEVKAAGLA